MEHCWHGGSWEPSYNIPENAAWEHQMCCWCQARRIIKWKDLKYARQAGHGSAPWKCIDEGVVYEITPPRRMGTPLGSITNECEVDKEARETHEAKFIKA